MKNINFKLNFPIFWLGLSLFISTSTLVYFLYALDIIGLIASILITSILLWSLKPYLKDLKSKTNSDTSYKFWLYGVISILATISALILAFYARTDQAIISPWQLINPWFFVFIALASLCLLLALKQAAPDTCKKILLSFYYLGIFSVASIIYKLGYGFDPFIHQAAMLEINKYGFILPKNPYYLGQYSVIILLHKISGLSLYLINQWLVPITSALLLPQIIYYLFPKKADNKSAWLSSPLIILLGFTPLIMTTPQNFSYLFLLATIIFIYTNLSWPLIVFSALATFAIHPLSGIPALALVTLFLLPKIKIKKLSFNALKRSEIIFASLFLIFCLTIWATSGFSPLHLSSYNLSLLNPSFLGQENFILNFVYFFVNNYFWLILAGAIIIFFQRHRLWPDISLKETKTLRLLSLAALAAISAYLISRGFSFASLINYEQDNYAARLPIIALILLIPIYWELFHYLSKRALKQTQIMQVILLVGTAIIMTIAVYGSYPRFDNYFNSRGYSTAESDIEAVHIVENLAQGQAYITLANQQVSAGALHEFGFHNRYLNNRDQQEIYFYPIPTGGPLYQYYLDMVYKNAKRETMLKAMEFSQVNRAYLIINKYWWASDKIIAEAKLSANFWQKIDDGKVYIFEYRQ
ncbi:MAG: hypothetical protein PHE20_03945 [Patescibacteria group bacterium]|nr:hypothetical protein [Patescibacteria group bacterium]